MDTKLIWSMLIGFSAGMYANYESKLVKGFALFVALWATAHFTAELIVINVIAK